MGIFNIILIGLLFILGILFIGEVVSDWDKGSSTTKEEVERLQKTVDRLSNRPSFLYGSQTSVSMEEVSNKIQEQLKEKVYDEDQLEKERIILKLENELKELRDLEEEPEEGNNHPLYHSSNEGMWVKVHKEDY